MKHESRREFLTAAGGAGLAAFMLAGRESRAAEAEPSSAEKENLKVVRDFCDAWATRDAAKICEHLAEDAVFRMTETAPPAAGRETIQKRLAGFLAMSKEAEFEILREAAMGQVVLNDRLDRFTMGMKKRVFHVTGIFQVKDGKIKEWTDYTWPGGEGEAE